MCTILFYPETLPAEKRSMEDSRKAVDRLMAFDRQLSEPFSREELKKLFAPEERRFGRGGYDALTEEEKSIVDELGLTPNAGNPPYHTDCYPGDGVFEQFCHAVCSSQENAFEQGDDTPVQSVEVRRRRMKASLIGTPNLATEEEVKELYKKMGNPSMFVGGLGFFPLSGSKSHSGQIFVWLDNMNFASEKSGFYYVRYQRSLLWGGTTAYAHPVLVVQKNKLRPDQIEYMDRKCGETLADRRAKNTEKKL